MVASRRAVSFLVVTLVLAWASAAMAESIREVRLETKDLVYDPVGGRIYASIPSSALSGPNRVVRINPDTGVVEAGVSVGTNPGKLAISSNGQYLYVAVANGTAVQRITLATLIAEPPFLLGSDAFFGAYSVEDMAVVPGSPGVIAVSRMNTGVSPRHAGVAVYDNGVQRPATTPRHTGANVIEFGSSTRLYGYNNETTEFGFRRMVVDATGVTVLDTTGNALSGFSIDIAYDAGRVYGTNGQVLNGEAKTLAGRLAGLSAARIRPDASVGRVFGLETVEFGLETTGRLLAWDLQTFRLLGALEIPAAVGEVSTLIRWGTDGLAFRTDRNQVYLVRTSLVAGAEADLAVTVIGPEEVPLGREFAYALVVTNNGPAHATEVLVQDQLPAGIEFLSVSSSQGTCTGTASVMCAIGNMAPGAIVTANVIVRATVATEGQPPLTNTASVSATTTDPHPANDTATLLTWVTPAAATHVIRRLNLATGDLVLDPATGRIYASLPGDSPAGGNSLVAIDPATGALEPPVFVGSEPGKLALSDDGQFLYVALDGSAGVRRVEMASATAGLQFALGSDSFFGPYYVEDMAVVPGDPHTIAVSRLNLSISPRHAGVAVYDNGVKRPAETARHTGANVIEFSQVSPTRLYGYTTESTEFGFRRMVVDAGGVSVVDVTENLISGFLQDIVVDGDRLYTMAGQVIDPEARLQLGTFVNAAGLVRPDSGRRRVFFFDGIDLSTFDIVTRAAIGSVSIVGVMGDSKSLIRWGGNGLAFRTTEGQLFLIETALVGGDVADLALTLSDAPDPVAEGGQITFTVGVENRGPKPATGVLVSDPLPAGLVPVSASASQGTCATTTAVVTCNLGSLANGATATATIVARATQAGVLQNTVSVSAATFDTVGANNTASVFTTVEPRRPLTVTLTGNGRGTVVSDPAGIQCGGGTCTANFDAGSVVTLDPRPEADSFFAGWSGDPDCADGAVTMTAAKTCTARFTRRADLVMTAFTGPAVAGAGQRITLANTVRNQAAAPASAGPFKVGLYLTPDQGFDRGHARFLGSRLVASLAAGATSAASTAVTIPEDFFECTCTLVAVADDEDTVPELNESNNVRLATVPITITRSDLVVTALAGPLKAGTGQKISVSTTVRNLGRAAVPHAFTVGVYLSASQAFDRNEARLLGRRTIASLGALGVSTAAALVTVPADLADGTYFLFAMADDGETVFEMDDTNNVFAAATSLMVVRPDLTIGTATASVTAARVITVSAVIQNRVTPGTPPAFNVGFYLSPSQAFDPATARLLQRRALPGLAGGASMTVATTGAIPADVAGGTYYTVVVADDGNAVIETDEANNVRVVTTPVSVVPPDLAMTAVSGPAVAGAGRAIPIVTTVRNLAAWAAPGFTAGLYLSPTPNFDPATSRRVGAPHTAGLGAKLTWTATTSVTVPADMDPGDYYIVAVADDANALAEVSKDNNTLVAPRLLKVVRPDLTVTAVSGPAVAANGQAIGVMVTAQNLAIVPGDARPFTIGVYLGTPPPGPGPRIGTLAIASLAAGRGVTVRVAATIPLGTVAGASVLIARVDDGGVLPELDETNNALAATAAIEIVRPDLQVTAVTAPAMLVVGQTVSVTTSIKNFGPAPSAAGPFTVDLILAGEGVDPTAPCTDGLCPRRVGGRAVARLGPGVVSTAATSVKLPADLLPGIWVVHAIVDPDQRVPESDEVNNTMASSALAILPNVRGTSQVVGVAEFDDCTDPSDLGLFFLGTGPLAITSQTGNRVSGTATFQLPTTQGIFIPFVFRLTATIDTESVAFGTYAMTATFQGTVVFRGEGTFQGRLTPGSVDLNLDGTFSNLVDSCHMFLNLASPPASVGASSPGDPVQPSSPLPRMFRR